MIHVVWLIGEPPKYHVIIYYIIMHYIYLFHLVVGINYSSWHYLVCNHPRDVVAVHFYLVNVFLHVRSLGIEPPSEIVSLLFLLIYISSHPIQNILHRISLGFLIFNGFLLTLDLLDARA